MPRVGLIFGGRSVEHRVSIQSARTVARGLEAGGHEVVPLGIALNGRWLTPEESERALSGEVDMLDAVEGDVAPSLGAFAGSGIEVAFPIVHGTWGEDGTLQGLFEIADVPYVGASVAASAVAMDKILCKRALAAVGVPVVDYVAVQREEFTPDNPEIRSRLASLKPPVFVKPSVGGSSVGIRRVALAEDLEDAVAFALRFDDAALVEREIKGRELECSVLGYPTLESSAVGEIVPGADFYDYADKYLDDNANLLIPANLEADEEIRIREIAVRAFAAIGGFGMARVDFLLENDGDLYLNEINTLPGFTSISMYPKLWEASGLSLAELSDRLVRAAIERHVDRQRLDAGIKRWVESQARP